MTRKATLLTDHFGPEPSLWFVIAAVAELANSLDSLNSALGITHRDIKPDNLFWLDGHALLGDFGIARGPNSDLMNLTADGRKLGSWGYIAPEALNLASELAD